MFYFVRAVHRDLLDDKIKRRSSLCMCDNPDKALEIYHALYEENIVCILNVEEAVWSNKLQQYVLKRTGLPPVERDEQ